MKTINKLLEKSVFIPNDKITNYDIAIVFGGQNMIPNRLNKAIELYNKNKVNKILVTGGIGFFNKNKQDSEASQMTKYLINNNIPQKDIIVENKSRSTKENIIFSINLLKKSYNLSNLNIILISSDYHIKRCKLLFSKYHKNISIFGTNTSKINKNTWSKSFTGYLTILKEFILIKISK